MEVSVIAVIFNINTGTWTQLQQMPDSRCGAGTFRVGSRIYVFG